VYRPSLPTITVPRSSSGIQGAPTGGGTTYVANVGPISTRIPESEIPRLMSEIETEIRRANARKAF